VTDWLFIGGADAVQDDSLQRHDILRVLSCCERVPLPSWTTNHVAKMQDSGEERLEPFLEESIRFLREAKDKQEKCLVLCYAGSSRSVTMVLAFLVLEEGIQLQHAWALVKRQRSMAQPSRNFARQLIELDRAAHGSTSVTLSHLGFDDAQIY